MNPLLSFSTFQSLGVSPRPPEPPAPGEPPWGPGGFGVQREGGVTHMGLEVTGCRTTCGARVGVSGTTSGNKREESETSGD